MPSIIEGYNYDIFISYRQKDNKHDGWVTEFVDNLKGELESTFKEEISVYFDINPHDGLLETHDVDASLKEKLKCLVFIPIISRTYCDPKSFAWEHEFKTFVELASQDQFGLKVKLPNGNVANRVLPIRIHDLDGTDIKECETVLGGVLRGVEFIYKEPGIDKPLAPNDNEKKNLNNTIYRIQIIKVAHAIKEIIQGMKVEPVVEVKEKILQREPLEVITIEEREEVQKKLARSTYLKWLLGLLITAAVVVAAILTYPKIFRQDKEEYLRSKGEISVVVMPFQNMTNDTIWDVWQDGIQNELISFLTNYNEELNVKQTGSINNLIQGKGFTNYASITPSIASKISQKLDANVFIYGSIKQAGDKIRINAQIIDSKTKEGVQSFQIDETNKEEMILPVIDSLKKMIKNYLLISKLENKVEKETGTDIFTKRLTNSPEAYRYFIYGNNAFLKERDMTTARNWYLKAISIDSNFFSATTQLIRSYSNQGMYDQAKEWCLKLYEKRDQMPSQQQLIINDLYAALFETPNNCIKYLKQILEIDGQQPFTYYLLGCRYIAIFQYDKAIPEFEKALEIYDKWGIKPLWVYNYTQLGYVYHETSQFKKEKKLYKKAEKDFPDDVSLLYRQAILLLTEKDTINAKGHIEKFKSILKEYSESEAAIAASLGLIYREAGILDKAEECYREALTLEPDNPDRLDNLAWLLIDKDRNINEGLELYDKALILSPDNYEFLDSKGWGFYKQGRYQEALEILQKSWDLRREQAIYRHEPFLHLEAAKKAVAGQKNN